MFEVAYNFSINFPMFLVHYHIVNLLHIWSSAIVFRRAWNSSVTKVEQAHGLSMSHFMFSQFLLTILLVIGTRAEALIPATGGEGVCSLGETVLRLVTTIDVVLFELSINTYIRQNTTINISGGKIVLKCHFEQD